MAKTQTETEKTTPTTPKRTRKVIKWQPGLAAVTCSAFDLLIGNRDTDPGKLALVAGKLQYVFESTAKTIKEGKTDADMIERRVNLELAMAVAGITDSDILDALDRFNALFN